MDVAVTDIFPHRTGRGQIGVNVLFTSHVEGAISDESAPVEVYVESSDSYTEIRKRASRAFNLARRVGRNGYPKNPNAEIANNGRRRAAIQLGSPMTEGSKLDTSAFTPVPPTWPSAPYEAIAGLAVPFRRYPKGRPQGSKRHSLVRYGPLQFGAPKSWASARRPTDSGGYSPVSALYLSTAWLSSFTIILAAPIREC